MEDMLRTAQVKDGREQNDATDVPETGNGESADDEEGDLRCDSATQRIQWALGLLNQNVKCFEALLTDLRLIADTVSMHFLLSSFSPYHTTPKPAEIIHASHTNHLVDISASVNRAK